MTITYMAIRAQMIERRALSSCTEIQVWLSIGLPRGRQRLLCTISRNGNSAGVLITACTSAENLQAPRYPSPQPCFALYQIFIATIMQANNNGSSSLQGAKRPPRASQRISLACRNCARQKVRCDKTIPCSRCRRKGLDCSRERNCQDLGRVDSSTANFARERLNVSAGSQHHRGSHSISISQRHPQGQSSAVHGASARASSISTDPKSYHGISAHGTNSLLSQTSAADLDCHDFTTDIATAIEGLAWGIHPCDRFPDQHCPKCSCSSDTVVGTEDLTEAIRKTLPSEACGRALVQFHMSHLRWDHNCLHEPTFMSQCEQFWQSGKIPNVQWISLYFAVLSVSIWSIENSHDPSFGMLEDLLPTESSGRFFSAMVDNLHVAQYMEQHTVFSIQAIAVASMVANVLGKSVLLNNLVQTCMPTAQRLGLHRIPDHVPCAPNETEERQRLVDNEIGKRVWWKLVQMDYFSIPYTNTYSMSLRIPVIISHSLSTRL